MSYSKDLRRISWKAVSKSLTNPHRRTAVRRLNHGNGIRMPEHLTVDQDERHSRSEGWAQRGGLLHAAAAPRDFFSVKSLGRWAMPSTTARVPRRGGQVKIVLMPSSPTATKFDQQSAVVAAGGFVEWNGTARNSANGKSQTYEAGVLQTGPKGEQFGEEEVAAKTYIFYFQDIV